MTPGRLRGRGVAVSRPPAPCMVSSRDPPEAPCEPGRRRRPGRAASWWSRGPERPEHRRVVLIPSPATLRPTGRPSLRGPSVGFRPVTEPSTRIQLLERHAELEQIRGPLRAAPPPGRRPGCDRGSGRHRQDLAARGDRGAGRRRADGGPSRARQRDGGRVRTRRGDTAAGADHRAAHGARTRAALRGCRGTGATAVRGGSRPSGRRRSPLRTLPRPALALREAGRAAAARPARRRCALGGRAIGSVPRLSRRSDRGDPGVRDPHRSERRGRGGASGALEADRAGCPDPCPPAAAQRGGDRRAGARRARRPDDGGCLRRVRTNDGRQPAARAATHRRARGAGPRGRGLRRRRDRRHGPAVGGALRSRPAGATLADGRGRGAGAGDSRRRCLTRRHGRGGGCRPPGGSEGGGCVDRSRAAVSRPAAAVRTPDHPTGAAGLDSAGGAGAATSDRRS